MLCCQNNHLKFNNIHWPLLHRNRLSYTNNSYYYFVCQFVTPTASFPRTNFEFLAYKKNTMQMATIKPILLILHKMKSHLAVSSWVKYWHWYLSSYCQSQTCVKPKFQNVKSLFDYNLTFRGLKLNSLLNIIFAFALLFVSAVSK